MIVVVGEQWNGRAVPSHLIGHWDATSWTPALALRLGAFNGGGSRGKLLEVGLTWGASANLLPPGHAWDAELAGRIAQGIRERMSVPNWIVMCGRRVAESFDATDLRLFDIDAERRLVAFPHPSGRSRVWNSAENWTQARACARELTLLTR